VPYREISAEQLASHGAAAVSRFAELVLALADRLARSPVAALKAGGVGAREITRLGKALGCEPEDARLALELCGAAGVLAVSADGWGLGPDADSWRALAPADRAAGLLAAWWDLWWTPTDGTDDDGRTLPALAARPCGGCRAARHAVLGALAELPAGAVPGPVRLGARALWRRPYVHVSGQGVPFAAHLAEATTLGLVAAGALTPLGRALVAADEARLRAVLAGALPAANDRALFGPDLTAVVTGTPAAEVSRLLDTSADRESRGAATVWRLSPASVRRALDEGYSAEELEARLAAVATGPLPQPLVYLIRDVGARHGALRVADAVSVIRSDDEVLLKQVAADRALRKLGLRLLTPTVLAAELPAEAMLSALRAAGYLPMPESGPAEGQAAPRPEPSHPAGRRGSAEPVAVAEPVSPADLVARLRSRPVGRARPSSATETAVRTWNPRLAFSEVRLLAHAIETGGRVSIDYVASGGGLTRRTIRRAELTGDAVLAWCELRQDERWFRLDRVQSVRPAP
jgi:hypothetical protein